MRDILIQIILMAFPWSVRRRLLVKIFGYELDKKSKIGFSLILAKNLVMKSNARIGHLNFVKKIDGLIINQNSKIGSRNWITGFSVTDKVVRKHSHFSHIIDRKCVLIIGENTSITSRHYFDCNGGIYIGNYVTVAGFETAFMTHSIDLKNNRQDAQPIKIGDFTFVGARCTILKGASLPDYSVLGACSLLTKQYDEPYYLYAGSPAVKKKSIKGYLYLKRTDGFVC